MAGDGRSVVGRRSSGAQVAAAGRGGGPVGGARGRGGLGGRGHLDRLGREECPGAGCGRGVGGGTGARAQRAARDHPASVARAVPQGNAGLSVVVCQSSPSRSAIQWPQVSVPVANGTMTLAIRVIGAQQKIRV